MNYHRLLEKQIKKQLSKEHLQDKTLMLFLESINKSYAAFERDKKISEHAFSISEKEYQEVTKDLRLQNEIREQSICKIKAAIRSLDSNAVINEHDGEDELVSIITYLEHHVAKTKELEHLLIDAKEAAEQATRAKSDFLSVMSHEIRTPLNAIVGNVHLLQQQDFLPQQEEHIRVLQIATDNLLNLINDVLDFGKIEEGKIIFSEKDIDIRGLLNNIKTSNRMRASEKGNTLRVMLDEDIPAVIKGDELRLGQVLNNLVSNAVKFTQNGQITIEAQLARSCAETVEIYFSVKDTGIGIAPEKQQLIFERFTQANSEITREYGGSGLGLTIISRLLQLQNSQIFLESKEGQGSTFHFTLPFKRSQTHFIEEAREYSGRPNLNGIKILLVEDVEFNVMVAEKMLHSWNASVQIAGNGLVAIGKAKTGDYDIILMDLQMPIMDGYSATKAIREFNGSVPIVALTASASPEMQTKVLETGMNDYVSKPFNPQDLFNTILKYTTGKTKAA